MIELSDYALMRLEVAHTNISEALDKIPDSETDIVEELVNCLVALDCVLGRA
jgi:hypothetical protein